MSFWRQLFKKQPKKQVVLAVDVGIADVSTYCLVEKNLVTEEITVLDCGIIELGKVILLPKGTSPADITIIQEVPNALS